MKTQLVEYTPRALFGHLGTRDFPPHWSSSCSVESRLCVEVCSWRRHQLLSRACCEFEHLREVAEERGAGLWGACPEVEGYQDESRLVLPDLRLRPALGAGGGLRPPYRSLHARRGPRVALSGAEAEDVTPQGGAQTAPQATRPPPLCERSKWHIDAPAVMRYSGKRSPRRVGRRDGATASGIRHFIPARG